MLIVFLPIVVIGGNVPSVFGGLVPSCFGGLVPSGFGGLVPSDTPFFSEKRINRIKQKHLCKTKYITITDSLGGLSY